MSTGQLNSPEKTEWKFQIEVVEDHEGIRPVLFSVVKSRTEILN